MKKLNKRLIQLTRYAYKSGLKLRGKKSQSDPVMIQAYRGYTNGQQFYLKGRVLEDKNIEVSVHDSRWRNLVNTFKRFESDELPGVELQVGTEGGIFHLKSDEEGYFTIYDRLKEPFEKNSSQWGALPVKLLGLQDRQVTFPETTSELLHPEAGASFGIISDMDDTVLQTYVTSVLGLRMLRATLFRNAHQRLPIEGIIELFQAFEKGPSGKSKNPFFYVSNSPWNLYDLLIQFLESRQLPKGPLLLRDYGLGPANFSSEFHEHKQETIARIMQTFPSMKFILLGDTGSKDADHYLALAKKYPEQILSIYIRYLKNTTNARRVRQLVGKTKGVDIQLVEGSAEIHRDALKKGYIIG